MTRKETYLSKLGIEVWKKREKKVETKLAAPANTSVSVGAKKPFAINAELASVNELSWGNLEKKVSGCTLCDLHKTRTNVVFGIGNREANILFIGEAPGANEDLQGEPFVGRGGMLLNAMLSSISLARNDVYIANVIKCRPPNNRDPEPQEVRMCTPFLLNQIALIRPKLIVAVGRVAAQFLLNTDESMARLRGREFAFGPQKIPLIVTYHPAYLLRSPREKSKAYQDFLQIKKFSRDVIDKSIS